MNRSLVTRSFALVLSGLAVGACDRGPAAVDDPAGGSSAPASDSIGAAKAPAVDLSDVVEATPDYIIGISYPRSAGKYPQLAALLKAYADAARADVMQAMAARPPGAAATMYDLSLSFTELLDTPSLVAYAADGSSYTGGAHGMPLVERFVWLPQEKRRLTATTLVPDPEGWIAIASHVREQLHTLASQRIDARELPPAQRAELVEGAADMIDEGTAPDPANFARFEPVVDASGKLVALRFVFPPYQVGPYAEGTQSVEVPAVVLLPHVAPRYRQLFAQHATQARPTPTQELV